MSIVYAIPLIRAFLGFVLLLSGVGKLLDPLGTQRAVAEYGVPLLWRGVVARLLPLVEIFIGIVFVLQLAPVLGSATALLMFTIFLIGVGRALSQSTTMDCHCFGALAKEQVSTVTLIRLILLVLMAGIVVGADFLMVKSQGFGLIGPFVETPERLISIAIVGSIGAFGLLLLRQLVVTLRAIQRTDVS